MALVAALDVAAPLVAPPAWVVLFVSVPIMCMLRGKSYGFEPFKKWFTLSCLWFASIGKLTDCVIAKPAGWGCHGLT